MRIIILFLLSVFSPFLIAQNNASEKENISPLSIGNTKPLTFEDYLVQVAWQNSPELEGQKYEIDARKEEISLAKKDWTRNLQAGLNLNQYNIDSLFGKSQPPANPNAGFAPVVTFPLWNIGLGINIGDLYIRKNKVKYAENRRKVSEADLNIKKQKIKGEVLTRYQEYLAAIEVLKVRLQALDIAETNKTQIANLFSVNKAQFEDYNQANKAYFDALEAKVKSDSDIKIRKIALEETLGIKWETVEKVRATYEKKN